MLRGVSHAIEWVLGRWIQATTMAPADEPLALDGKRLRGAHSGEQVAPHRLSFVTHQSQETFFQMWVDEKTNEIPVAKQVLPTLPMQQRVCTADALLSSPKGGQQSFTNPVLITMSLCGRAVPRYGACNLARKMTESRDL